MAINSAFMETKVRRQKRVGHQLPLQSSNGLGAEVTFAEAVRQVAIRLRGDAPLFLLTAEDAEIAETESAGCIIVQKKL